MNGSNPIFPLIGNGRAAPAQTGQASENGNTAFAENLTAALTGLSQTTVLPAQQKVETPAASFQIGLIEGSLDTVTAATDQPVLKNGIQGTGAFGPVGNAGIESAGSADIDAHAGPLASTEVSDSDPSANDLHVTDIVNARKIPAFVAAVDHAPAGTEGVSPAQSTAERIDRPIQPAIRQPEPSPIQSVAVGSPDDVELDRPEVILGGRPLSASPMNFEGQPTPITPVGIETAPVDEASQAPMRVLSEMIADASAGVKTLTSSEASPADAALDLTKGPTAPASLITAEDPTRPTPSLQVSPGYQTIAQRASAQPQTEQPVIEKSAGGESETSSQLEASNLVASRGESVLPARKRSAGAQSGEAFQTVMRPDAAGTGQNDPSEGRTSADRQGAPAVTVNEPAAGKSTPGISPLNTAQTAIMDGVLRPTAEFGGVDRLQPALSLEGTPLDSMRFEPASNQGQSRAQTPLAHAPAGTQIALQIVRSVPEGVDRFSLHLQPADLGSVDIQLDFEGGGRMSALITAEKPETLELLQRDSRLLERSLGDTGLKLASDGLSFALKQDHQQQQQGQSFQEQAQARQQAFHAGRAYDETSDTEQVLSATRVDGLRLLDIET